MTDILFLQTADAFRYKPMLEATSRTVVEYCRRHGFGYESFVGVRRGAHPWQATFNRIPMLHDLLQRGFGGWAVYLDADAYIHDLDFDLRFYLAGLGLTTPAVMVSMGADCAWAVNAGVFLLNLATSEGREIVARWNAKFAALEDVRLAEMIEWRDECSDQSMLFEVFDENEHLREKIKYETYDLMNHNHSRFIRQILRAYYPDIETRIQAVRTATEEVMAEKKENLVDRLYPLIISALYRTVLRRDPDADGLVHFRQRFLETDIETAVRSTLSDMLGSEEYRNAS